MFKITIDSDDQMYFGIQLYLFNTSKGTENEHRLPQENGKYQTGEIELLIQATTML